MEFVRTPDDRFDKLVGYPFEPRYVELGSGLRMHCVDEGPRRGRPVLLLHGQPTWSYLYRSVIPTLSAAGYRAIAPDMVGFGRSDKPTARTAYSVGNHIGWLTELLDAIGLDDLVVVAQDWGGPIGLGALAAAPHRFAAVVATNTILHTADASLAGKLTWACHATSEGRVEVESVLLDYQRITQELTPFRPSLFVGGATSSDVAPAVLAAYDAPFPDERFCAGARQLPTLMGLTPGSECARINRRTSATLAGFSKPFLTAYSDEDPSTRGWERVLRDLVPGAAGQPHAVIGGAGHFLQEDAGPALARVIVDFLARSGL